MFKKSSSIHLIIKIFKKIQSKRVLLRGKKKKKKKKFWKKCSEKFANNLKTLNKQSNLIKLANTILADRKYNLHDTYSDKLSNTSTSDPNEEFIK